VIFMGNDRKQQLNPVCPPWNELKNEVGKQFNDFNILRGKEFIEFGQDVWVGYFCILDGSGGLKIGDHVTIASGAHIYTHDSSFYRVNEEIKDPINGTHCDRGPVLIGDNVQIGANSIILPGVTIGNNVLVGALTLVNKNIPDNSLVVGSPCKIKKLKKAEV
jgi:acetyltransferase-like isoleucine patch superfamily enzyme